jgi:serine/threonine-protein kinase
MRLGNLVTAMRWRKRLTAPNGDVQCLQSVVTPAEGVTVNSYELIERLDSGGFGSVFRARHRELSNEVAIKFLHAERCEDGNAVARFIAEARTVSALRHPQVVDVFSFGTTDSGNHYFVMELLRGESLASLLEHHRLSEAEALECPARQRRECLTT